MKEKMSRIERYSYPSELDTADQFTLCICADHSAWVQVAKEQETPRWVRFESEEEADSFIDDIKSNC